MKRNTKKNVYTLPSDYISTKDIAYSETFYL